MEKKICKNCIHYNKGMCHKEPKAVKFVSPDNDKCKWEKKHDGTNTR